jgi:hypothetical protein
MIEELGECQKELIKCLRFGREQFCEETNNSNFERFLLEWSDLMGTVEKLKEDGIIVLSDPYAVIAKMQRIEHYYQKSIEMGAAE